jgi:hypothetical protein
MEQQESISPNRQLELIAGPEFLSLLRRAMEIQGAQVDTEVSEESVLTACREQGLEEDLVRLTFAEFKDRQRRVLSIASQEASAIKMSLLGNDLVFVVPPVGAKRNLLVRAVIGIVLVGLPFLKILAVGAIVPISVFFAFPLIGSAYLILELYRICLREHICLTLQGGRIERSIWKFRWCVAFRTDALKVSVEEGLLSGTGRLTLESRETEHYVEVQRLLAGYDLAEKRWVAECISRWIGPKGGAEA